MLDGTHEDVSRILDEVSGEDGLAPLDRLRVYMRRQVAYNLENLERVAVYHHDLERLGDERRGTSCSGAARTRTSSPG